MANVTFRTIDGIKRCFKQGSVRRGGSEKGLRKASQKTWVFSPSPLELLYLRGTVADAYKRGNPISLSPANCWDFCAVLHPQAEFNAGRMEDLFRCHQRFEEPKTVCGKHSWKPR